MNTPLPRNSLIPNPLIPNPLIPGDLRRTGIDPNFWYPLCRAGDLKTNKPQPVSFAGAPIVLVRTGSDRIFALEDRCAHRQVPLHEGVVRGEHLQCGYHGWTYDATGRCAAIPYAGAEACQTRAVKSYPAKEAYGFIFVYPGEADASVASFPDIPSFSDSRYKTRVLDRRVACHYSFMHENLMDMNHQVLHRRLMGKIKTTCLGHRAGVQGVEVDYTFSRLSGAQPLGERFIIGAPDGPDHMTIATHYPYQTLRYYPPGETEPALDLWNVYVPLDAAQKTNHTFGLLMVRKPAMAWLIHVMWPFIAWFTEGIFAEDRTIVETEQRAYDAQGADWNQEVFPAIQALKGHLIECGVPLAAESGR